MPLGGLAIGVAPGGVGSEQVTFDLSASSLIDFGPQVVAGSSAPKGIAVLNTGTAPLTIEAVSTPPGFSAVQDCAGVAPGEQCTINVTFAPTAAQGYSGNMDVTAVGSTSTKSVPLAGQGVTPAIEVRANGVLVKSYDFGSTGAGTTSDIVTFSLKNVSGATITFGAQKVSVEAPFSRSSTSCGTTLAANATCTVGVTFSPTSAQAHAGSLNIDANTSAYIPIQLAGTGAPQPLSTWNLVDYPAALPTAVWDIEYANGFYAAVGDGSRLSVGATLETLHQAYYTTGATGTYISIVPFKDMWVVADRGYGRINIWKGLTANAINQAPTTQTTGYSGTGYSSLETDGNRLVAGTGYPSMNSSLATTDGVTWQASGSRIPDIGASIDSIKQANGTWVAVGGNNVFALSTDGGATWVKRGMGIAAANEQATSVTYGAGTWVMTTSRGRVFTSPDGSSWQARSTPASDTATSLNWVGAGPGGFVAVGNAGTILQSVDGQRWVRMTSPFPASVTLRKVKYINGQWLILGSTLQFAIGNP